MSLLFIDGCTHYEDNDLLKKWDGLSNTQISTTLPRRSGVKSIRQFHYLSWLMKLIDPAASTLIFGFATYHSALPGNDEGVGIKNVAGYQLTFQIRSDGSVAVYRGDTGDTLIGTTPIGTITAVNWQYVEYKAKIDNANGTWEVRVNGISKGSGSGLDTQKQATNDITKFVIGCGTIGDRLITDLYICDDAGAQCNDFLGDCRVDTLMPSGSGNYSEWDVLVGPANYQDVDDPGDIDDDTTYVSTGVGAEKDSYAFENLTAIGRPILGVQSCLCARKDDAGDRRIKHLIRISAANYLSEKQVISDSYIVKRKIWENNPATASAWTESSIDNAEFGVQLVTTTTTTSTTSTTTTV